MPYASGKKRIDYQRDLRNKRAAKGLCTRCGEKVKGIRLDCERCLRNANRLVQVIVKRNLKKGRCRCGRKRVSLKKVCQRCRDNSRDILRQLKEQVLAGYGKRCVCCGETIYEFLSIDHKYNDGADDRKRMGAKSKAASLYRTIIAEGFPDRYQILCYNCNMAKGFFGYCPHQKLEEYAIHNSESTSMDR